MYISPEVVTAGGQNRFVNLEALVVNGQNHIQQLTLITQHGQPPQESVAVAGGRESTTERAILVVSHAGKKKENQLRGIVSLTTPRSLSLATQPI